MLIFFELSILLSWLYVFKMEKKNGYSLESFILIYGLLTTFTLEVINEVCFGHLGMVYPHSYFLLWPFRFPLPIILSGSLYCWGLHKVSFKTSKTLFKNYPFSLIYPLLIIFLLNTWYFVEFIGLKSGYWMRIGGIEYTKMVILLSYLFYCSFTLPSILCSFLTCKYLNKRSEQKEYSRHCV